MPDAHAAAVEAMAEAIMRPDVREHYRTDPHPAAAAYYRERATDALAALVRSEAVRAALVEARHDVFTQVANDVTSWIRTEYHVQRPCCIDAILAALAPPEEEE